MAHTALVYTGSVNDARILAMLWLAPPVMHISFGFGAGAGGVVVAVVLV